MIVRHFLQWVRLAPPGERADAVRALVGSYLYSNLDADDRAAAEGAMIMLLDDPSPMVRYALADTLAGSRDAPPAVILALSADQPEIAALVLAHSPQLLDADLVDAVGGGDAAAQAAVASRAELPSAVIAAIAEVGSAESCLIVAENHAAAIPHFSMQRIIARHGHLAAVREALFARGDVPPALRQALVAKLSETLADFVTAQSWLEAARARRVAREACEKATVVMASATSDTEVRPLVKHLRQSGQLTAGLVLRVLLSGNLALFEESLAELSGLSLGRVGALLHDRSGKGLLALFERAGLPAAAIPALRAALTSLHENGVDGEFGGASRLKRRMVERVLAHCEGMQRSHETEPLLILLRRFALEAARDEARMFCDELAAA